MRAWVIDRDYLAEPNEPTRIGYGMTDKEVESTLATLDRGFGVQIDLRADLKASEVEQPVRWRALDDDGEVYYGGAVTSEWVTGADDESYLITKFVEADAGATDVQFRAKDLPEEFVERHRGFATVTDGGTEWVIVHG